MQLQRLENGVQFKYENKLETFYFFLIAGVYDKPARTSVINMKASNGFNGCVKCLQPGVTLTGENGGHSHIYPFKAHNPKGQLRNKINYLRDLMTSNQINGESNGVLSPCCLSYLKYFNPVESTCIDYMHSVLEGVVKSLFEYWFSPEYSRGEHSVRKYMQEIDKRLLSIKPPTFVPYTPRPIFIYNLWRAHEYMTFILYYALPVFREILADKYYKNLIKLVIFLENLLLPKFDKNFAQELEKMIFSFVRELEYLYPPNVMRSGVHELVHLVDCTLDYGPLNIINCFQFEELNRKITRLYNGQDLIGEEIINNFSTLQSLAHFSFQIMNPELRNLIFSKINVKSSNKKTYSNQNVIKVVGKRNIVFENKYLKIYNSFFYDNIDHLEVFYKINHNGLVLSSYNIKSKRGDYCILNYDNKVGLIESFFFRNEKVFIYCKLISCLPTPFYCTKYPEIKSSIEIACVTNQFFITEPRNCRKIVLIELAEDDTYISCFNMSHLFK